MNEFCGSNGSFIEHKSHEEQSSNVANYEVEVLKDKLANEETHNDELKFIIAT